MGLGPRHDRVPTSDAEQLGHELAHGEDELYGLVDNEDNPYPGRIGKILQQPVDPDLAKDAAAFVEKLLKPLVDELKTSANVANGGLDTPSDVGADTFTG
jgi:hypothetical protein